MNSFSSGFRSYNETITSKARLPTRWKQKSHNRLRDAALWLQFKNNDDYRYQV